MKMELKVKPNFLNGNFYNIGITITIFSSQSDFIYYLKKKKNPPKYLKRGGRQRQRKKRKIKERV